MQEDIIEQTRSLKSKVDELGKLLNKGVFKNLDTYNYYFKKWHSETLYILANVYGEKSKQYTRFEKSAQLPSGKATESRWIQLRRAVMLKAGGELEAILSVPGEHRRNLVVKSEGGLKQQPTKGKNLESYVDSERMEQLRAINSDRFDLSKLSGLCEELNKSYDSGCYLAVTMLIRAILDHVPPIFDCKSFADIANTYSGPKSFKASMIHLDNSLRKIADAYLHIQIRKSETLPNKTQVNFSPDLDVLLAEIVRILK